MKRQHKPFAVEIKRSRRSPLPPSSSKGDSAEGGRTAPDEDGSLDKISRRGFDADLAVPAFLQPDKPSRRPASKVSAQDVFQEVFKDRDHVFASVPPRPADAARQSESPARARILPSLIEPAAGEPGPQIKPAKRASRNASASAAEPKRTPRAGRRTKAQPAPAFAAEAQTRPDEAALKNGGSAARSNPGGKRSGAANKALASGKTRKPTAGTFVAPPSAAEAARDAWPPALPVRSLTKRSRVDAADLPPGQRWKRRLHPRAW